MFDNLEPWDSAGGRFIQPIGRDFSIDFHNDCMTEGITLEVIDAVPQLVFHFKGYAKNHMSKEPNIPIEFNLIFINALVTPNPDTPQFPYMTSIMTDDFIIQHKIRKDLYLFSWYGDTNSVIPDPEIHFLATRVVLDISKSQS